MEKRLKVKVTVDRPIGYKDDYGNIYPLNYGFIAGVIGGDGEEQDAYILTESKDILHEFIGEVIAIVVREDDVEEKWVVSDEGKTYTVLEIYERIEFIEKYFCTKIELV